MQCCHNGACALRPILLELTHGLCVGRRRCGVHVFDPTLSEEQRKQVAAIHGLTLHEYGLGTKDGQVRGVWTPCSSSPFFRT